MYTDCLQKARSVHDLISLHSVRGTGTRRGSWQSRVAEPEPEPEDPPRPWVQRCATDPSEVSAEPVAIGGWHFP
jgi:hypothetical protein